MRLIDANVILRYLLKEPQDQAERARDVIEAGAFTTMEVTAEVVYVLQKVYSVNRAEVSAAIAKAAGEIAFDEYDVLILALELFGTRNLDFVDCVLAARSVVKQDDVFTFDRKLAGLIEKLSRNSQGA